MRESQLSCSGAPNPGLVVPDYLGPHDYPWLRALIDEYARFSGKPAGELVARLREPLRAGAHSERRQRAMAVLDRLCRARVKPVVKPAAARAALFAAAASPAETTESAWRRAADQLEVDVATLEACLFADLPSQRRIAAPPDDLTPLALANHANLAMAQSVVRRATSVRLDLAGNARSVVRLARLRGLICVVDRPADPFIDAQLAISGPLSLFRRTRVYGNALASLIPGLAWCTRFRLVASCHGEDGAAAVEIRSGDPIFPSAEPRRFDSRLEARFARDFARAAPDWEIIREPEPLTTGHGLIFPDFALEHRRDRRRRWLLEIIGYWTESYLQNKLAGLASARVDNLIICIDADRNCDHRALPKHATLVAFRRHIDPQPVLAILETGQHTRCQPTAVASGAFSPTESHSSAPIRA